jgi:molecular chaperone DnaK (HSP70)
MIAIDQGAAHSRVAVMEGASPRVIPNLVGSCATPTIVAFTEDGDVRVGEAARRASFEDASGSGVLPVLGLLGRKLDARGAREVRRWAPAARLAAAPNGDLRVIVADDALSPAEIAAHLLGHFQAAAERYLAETVDEVVVAVPAAFDDIQRQAVRDAGEIVGMRVVRLVNRSAAVALGAGLANGDRRRNVAVCDFGGDGFDMSILEVDGGWVRVRATAGILAEPGVPLLEPAEALCRRALADARLAAEPIDEALLLGAQAQAACASDLVRRAFGKPPGEGYDLDDGVVRGAAVLAGILQGEVRGLVLLDATSHTLGIETRDGTFTPVIERNSTIPTRKRRVFTTIADNQTRVLVHVLQGESDLAAYNRSLHKFELVGIPRAPRGKPQIEVAFAIDVDGTMSVEAADQETDRRQAIRVHASAGLGREEVERLAALWLAKASTPSSRPSDRFISMRQTA